MRSSGLALVVVLLASHAHGLLVSTRGSAPLRVRASVQRRQPPPAAIATPSVQLATAVGLNSALGALGLSKGVGAVEEPRMLTRSGLVHAWVLGVCLWTTLGWRAWSTCVLYLVGGSAVTKVKKAKKEALGIAEGRGGARGPENVWGSAATAALCALGAAAWPARGAALRLGLVASLATKLSDTCASEIGKAYGKTTYLITTLQKVPPGTEGAVSAEGTGAGAVASVVLSLYGVACGLVGPGALLPCVVAAFVATTVESLIGASAQGRYAWLTNEVVNFINTLIGAVVGIALGAALGVV